MPYSRNKYSNYISSLKGCYFLINLYVYKYFIPTGIKAGVSKQIKLVVFRSNFSLGIIPLGI